MTFWHGCAHIAGLYPIRSGDFLTYGAGLVKGLGFRTIKLELSVAYETIKYIGQTFSSSSLPTLTALAQETGFDAIFSDSGFDRVVLTCFSIADPTNNSWNGKWTKAIGDTQENEMYDLANFLLSTYSGKEFIIQNWEGDWQLLNSFNPHDPIPRTHLYAYRDFHRRRIRAVKKAITDNPSSTSTIKYMMELNRGLDGWGERVLRSVLTNIKPDIVSFSAYEAIEGWHGSLSQSAFEADIETKLTKLYNKTRAIIGPTIPIVIGEYGWPIDRPEFSGLSYNVGNLWLKVITVATALGIVGHIPWQILDNEEQSPGVPNGFAMYNRNGNSSTVGSLNASGAFFSSYL